MYKLLPLVLISGYCALSYQTAWFRLFRLIFGSSTPSTAAVLAIFMGGLGFGSLIFGHISDRSKSPLKLYAKLEITIAVSAALSPFLLTFVKFLYVSAGGTAQLGMGPGTLVKLVLSFLVLIIPTLVIGGTLPAIARAVLVSRDQGRRSLGTLYGINTLGAVLGVFGATFYSFEHFGIRNTIWIAAVLNLLIGITAYLISMGIKDETDSKDSKEPFAAHTHGIGQGETVIPRWLALASAAVVGFAFFLMEIVWYRMLAPVLGGSSYTFGMILSVALFGIGIGGIIYGIGSKKSRPSLNLFALTCSLEALFMIVPFALGDNIAIFANSLQHKNFEFMSQIYSWTIIVLIVVLIPSIIAGYQFPLLVALVGRGREHIGRHVGEVYVFNTLGSIAGSLAGGFGLLPLLTAINSWRLSALLLVITGLVIIFRGRAERKSLAGSGVSLVACILAIILMSFTGPTSFWRHSGIGVKRAGDVDSKNELNNTVNNWRRWITWQADGIESSVAIDESYGNNLIINGKSDGSARLDAPTMVMTGIVPAILHEKPHNALVIGMGLGLTAGWIAEVDTIDSVTVVELEEAVLHVAEKASPVNLDLFSNPKLEVVIGDGREYLITTTSKYDLIISEPSNPYRAGVASLFTSDFYESVRKKLADGGIFAQWLQAYEINIDMVKISIATLKSVFPYVEVWHIGHSDLLFIASNEKLAHDTERIKNTILKEPFNKALIWTWGVDSLEGFYAGYIASDETTQKIYEEEELIHTDDRPVLEFLFIRNLGIRESEPINDLKEMSAEASQDRYSFLNNSLDPVKIQDQATARDATLGLKVPWPAREMENNLRQRIKSRSLLSRGRFEDACEEWLREPWSPHSPLDLTMIVECLALEGNPDIFQYIGQLREIQPAEAKAALARYYYKSGQGDKSIEHVLKSFELFRSDPWPNLPVMERNLELAEKVAEGDRASAKKIFDSLKDPFSVNLLDENRKLKRFKVSLNTGNAEDCVDALKPFEPYLIWEEQFLKDRLKCYEGASSNSAKRAKKDLELFLTNDKQKSNKGTNGNK